MIMKIDINWLTDNILFTILGAELVDSVLDIDWLIYNILFTMLGAELIDSVLHRYCTALV